MKKEIKFEYSEAGIDRIGLEKYPKEPYAIFELPVRLNKKKYQVWTGKNWYQLRVKKANL